MAHTPAPWFIEADTGFGASYHMRRAVITADEHEANARLIAAAPDLLAALKDARALAIGWAGHYRDFHGLDQFHPLHERIIVKASEAILKAEAA